MTPIEIKVAETLEAWNDLPDFKELVTVVADLINNEIENRDNEKG